MCVRSYICVKAPRPRCNIPPLLEKYFSLFYLFVCIFGETAKIVPEKKNRVWNDAIFIFYTCRHGHTYARIHAKIMATVWQWNKSLLHGFKLNHTHTYRASSISIALSIISSRLRLTISRHFPTCVPLFYSFHFRFWYYTSRQEYTKSIQHAYNKFYFTHDKHPLVCICESVCVFQKGVGKREKMHTKNY